MKDSVHKYNKNDLSNSSNKLMLKIFGVVIILCISIIGNNNILNAKYKDNKSVEVDSSLLTNNSPITNKVITSGNIKYSIDNVEQQEDENNPLLGKDLKYIIVTIKIQNGSNKVEIFDAFDMVLEAAIKNEKKVIRNISEYTIYNVQPETESKAKLVYIVPKNISDIHIKSEKNSNIDFEVEI
ncbi:hypothetical protein [Clostridium omnivorum]|uniref:DUF4352 domain-containing protein n=1 Tax=Clostridium omnivorum TaxID=1604902 RepID=A0ABQ5N3G4_9CLOT|nr:hypothetical protein [Clostridium sp. E14]GLC29720.1 hypothetical protein bsdE14_11300 [Clostridium sp. E14]